MKYIIDVPKNMVDSSFELLVQYRNVQDVVYNYHTGISAIPYDESLDNETIAEQRGQEEAWELAQRILKNPGKDGMLNTELNNCFGTDDIYLIGEMSYTEVKAKYEAWKKQKDEINIGDEIIHEKYGNCVIFEKERNLSLNCFGAIDESGVLYQIYKAHIIRKTGRHFPEVAELLKKLSKKLREPS